MANGSSAHRITNGVMVVARPGWHYMTEEDGIEDVERLIDQSL
jgi:hypothetical protein